MRRKSDRNKAKSPEKVEKPKRGRPPRRRKKSSSSSPERVSVIEEVVPESQDAEMSEVPMTSTSVLPNPIVVASDDEDTDQVWHVKASESSGDAGEKIQKLKICLSRPSSTPERPDRSPRGRKKLNRTSQLEFSSESSEEKRKSRHRSRRGSTRDSNTEENISSDNAEKDVPCREISPEKNDNSDSPTKGEYLATPLDDDKVNKNKDKLKTSKSTDGDSKIFVEEKIPQNDLQSTSSLLGNNSENATSSHEDDASSENKKKQKIPSPEKSINVESSPEIVQESSPVVSKCIKVSSEEAMKTTTPETISIDSTTKLELSNVENTTNETSDATISAEGSFNIKSTIKNVTTISSAESPENQSSCEPSSKKEEPVIEKVVGEPPEVKKADAKLTTANSPPGEDFEMTCKSPKVEEAIESLEQSAVSNDKKVHKSPIQTVKSPIQVEKSPNLIDNSPIQEETSPIKIANSPIHVEKSLIKLEKPPIQVQKSSTQAEKSPKQIENSPEQVQKSILHTEDSSVESIKKSVDVPVVKMLNDVKSNLPEERLEKNMASNTLAEVVSTSSIRKRKWGSRSSKITKASIVNISTDSLKNLISHVEPVSVEEVIMDIKLKEKNKSDKVRPVEDQRKSNGKYGANEKKKETKDILGNLSHRKISIVSEEIPKEQRPPSPPRFKSSSILYITNLVRPFTLPQLKNLLQRTGKLAENGFWIDKIKSRCFVQYQTEEQAIETRHALHGVTWPTSNPKTLNVDFGLASDMREALASGEDEMPSHETWPKEQYVRDSKISGKENNEKMFEKRTVVREWDVGKGDGAEQRVERPPRGVTMGAHHSLDPLERERGRKRRTKSPSPGTARKFKKKEEEAPSKLLDDLFKKTKATPCIYWLPLNAETILVKEEQRRKHMAEHERRMEELRRAAEQDQRGPRNPPHHSSAHRHR